MRFRLRRQRPDALADDAVLPQGAGQLRWLLARRLGLAATLIGLTAAGISWFVETQRAEQGALENAERGVRHFESSAVRMMGKEPAADEHAALSRLLDRTRFVGIRVFSAEHGIVFEEWADVPASLKGLVRSSAHRHEWPEPGQTHKNWLDSPDDRLIQIVLPLISADGSLGGYLEGISRLDRQAIEAQRAQVRNGALTASLSVVIAMALLYPLMLAMLRRSTRLSSRLLEANVSLLRSLGNAIAKRDSDTDIHNYRVTYYAIALAEAMALPEREIAHLVVGAFLHDVGKIGIPDNILLKPGKLSDDEFKVMKTHVLLGIDIVDGDPWLQCAVPTIRSHHERFDGSGYPDGLTGKDIPIVARVFAVVDVFDALTSERPYKPALPFEDAMVMIDEGSGRHFDPEVVELFHSIAPRLFQTAASAEESLLKELLGKSLARYFQA